MSRFSDDVYGENGDLIHGFDYDLQVWVEDGVIEPVGSGYQNNPGWAGKKWKEANAVWAGVISLTSDNLSFPKQSFPLLQLIINKEVTNLVSVMTFKKHCGNIDFISMSFFCMKKLQEPQRVWTAWVCFSVIGLFVRQCGLAKQR